MCYRSLNHDALLLLTVGVVVRPRCCFFFSSRRRHTRCYRDWSSDVCSSDLLGAGEGELLGTYARGFGDGAGDPFRAGPHLHCRAHRSLLSVAYRIAFGYARVAATSMSAKKRSEERRVGKESRSRRVKREYKT